MKKYLLTILLITLSSTSFAQETTEARRARRGQASGYGSRSSTALSMMGWGVGLAVGFAAICALIDNNSSDSQSH